ncbi:MAG: hypothetical protein RIS45_774, partial [Planctomycetota bacterium]
MKPSRAAEPSDLAQLDGLIARQRFPEAVALAERCIARNPKQHAAYTALARALIPTGRLGLARDALDRGLRLVPDDPSLNLLKGIVDHRLGQSDDAIARLGKLLSRRPANEADVAIALAEALHRANRKDEFEALIARGGAWTADERASVFTARVALRTDRAKALESLIATARGTRNPLLKRIAGFEAVRLLDADGRYREAFDLATYVHAETTPTYDIGAIEADVSEQLQLLDKGRAWFTPKGPQSPRTAVVVGMPRSGTTLLEQMLDRHPKISGIGEYEGVFAMDESLLGLGLWPRGLRDLRSTEAAALAAAYLEGAAARRRSGAEWTFDKTLHAWRMLPAVAAVLPGASFVRITRDPRDTAISMFLSNFHPKAWGYTASLSSIRRVIELERRIVPKACEVLGLRAVSVRSEDLVDAPEREIRRVLETMGVDFDPVVLTPEANTRTVLTLSYEQVRRSINRSSIGRWRNYEFAFGAG